MLLSASVTSYPRSTGIHTCKPLQERYQGLREGDKTGMIIEKSDSLCRSRLEVNKRAERDFLQEKKYKSSRKGSDSGNPEEVRNQKACLRLRPYIYIYIFLSLAIGYMCA